MNSEIVTTKPTPDGCETDPRLLAIWAANAWAGMNQDLSAEARSQIFDIAIRDVLPDVTDREVGFALGMVAPN